MPSSVKSYFSHTIAKSIVAGGVAAAGDMYIMKNPDMKSCAMFGGAVAGGVLVAANIGEMLHTFFPTHTPMGAVGKNLEARVIEVAFGAGGAYALNHFLIKGELNHKNMLYKLAIIGAADVIGESVCELLLLV